MLRRPLGDSIAPRLDPSRLRAVLFDAGNTLVHIDYEFVSQLLLEHGQLVPPREIRRAEYLAKRWIDRSIERRVPGNDAKRRMPYFGMILDEIGVPAEDTNAILEKIEAANADDCLWRTVWPGTIEALNELRNRGLRIAVVSNADGRIEADLPRRGLVDLFETVVDSHVVGVEKPNPRIFQIALERLGLQPSDALYVGDIYSIDVRGARYAGMDAVLFDSLEHYDGVDCHRISSLGELVTLLADRPAGG